MKRCIATVSLSGTLEDKLRAIAAAGFDGVEIFENDLVNSGASPRQIRELASQLGLSVDLFQPFRDLEGVPDEVFRRNLDRAERKFDVMGELGAPMLLVCSNVGTQALPDSERAVAQLHALAERARQRDLRIAYEALAWGRHVRTYGQAWDLVRRADHPALGLCIDSFHTLALGDDPQRHRQHSGRSHLLSPAGRRTETAHGSAVVESPLPLFSRSGGAGCVHVGAAGAAERVSRSAIAGDLQRRVP